MPRTSQDIQADIDAAKSRGVHQASREMKALRKELAAVNATTTESNASGASSPQPAVSESAAGTANADPLKSDEWRFIEKVIAEMQIEFSKGSTTGAMKKIYNELDARIKMWRLSREIVAQIGPGNEWPQWAALGRNDSTGRREDRPAPPPRPVVAPDPVPPTTEGGMPIRSAKPPDSEILAQFGGAAEMVAASIASRARPAPVPAGAPA